MAGKRNFTGVVGNKEHGTYTGSSPSSAARKAVSKLCADDKKKKVTFSDNAGLETAFNRIAGNLINYSKAELE